MLIRGRRMRGRRRAGSSQGRAKTGSGFGDHGADAHLAVSVSGVELTPRAEVAVVDFDDSQGTYGAVGVGEVAVGVFVAQLG